MDIYQERLLRNTKAVLLADNYEKDVKVDTEKVVLEQSENYTIEDYVFKLENPQIDYIVVTAKKETKYVPEENIINIPFKTNNLFSSMKVYFKGNLADACELSVEFQFKDKEIWDTKVREEKVKNLKELLSLTCKTGINILNVIWSNVSKEVHKTTLKIYAKENHKELLMIEKSFENDVFFYSLDKLAFGNYIVRIAQTDKNNDILIEDESSVIIDNDLLHEISALGNSLSNGLSEVKTQVRASGRHTVCN